jgi:hypothetical protein
MTPLVVVPLLGLLLVFLLWFEPLAWWTKALGFTMADLASVGLLHQYFGSYLSFYWMVATFVIASGLAAIAFLLSWPTKPPTPPWGEMMMRRIRRYGHQDESDRLADLDHGLTDVVEESSRMPFRDRVTKYCLLETEGENLVGANHEEFYVNPELLADSEAASAHLTDLATRLLRKVKDQRRRIKEKIAAGD